MSSLTLRASIPRALVPLLQPKRYKGAHGGRGGAKSHFFAEQIVIRCATARTRIVCIREVQNSIKESVKQLLEDKIAALGLGHVFEVLRDEIRHRHNGSLIIFRGMQSYNAHNIKSLEDFDIAWIEEAQTMSAVSLRLLRPTLRKDGSEIWASWNPRYDSDPIDVFLRGAHKPGSDEATVVEVNWRDNPWFPDVLRKEMALDFATDPEMAEHVWNGGYEIISEGSYYARLLAAAEKEGRVGFFPYNPALPVHTSWDLGISDFMPLWFWQEDGTHATVIDFFETNGVGLQELIAQALPEHLADALAQRAALQELGRDVPYRYGTHYLPHDVAVRELGAGGRSRAEVLRALGLERLSKGVACNPEDRISASRRIMPIVRFNRTKSVESGMKRLRRYRKKFNDALGIYLGPIHDENSHAADAFGEFAVNCQIVSPPVEVKVDPIHELTRERSIAEVVGAAWGDDDE